MNKAQEFRAEFRANAVFRSADWLGRCFWSTPKFLGVYIMGPKLTPNSNKVPPLKRRDINAARMFSRRLGVL